MDLKKLNRINLSIAIALFLLIFAAPAARAEASASAVSIGAIDYDALTIQVYKNDNSIVYYSTDKSNWTQVEGEYDSTTKSYEMDISWVSSKNDVTLYYKGDTVKTVKSVTLPAQNTTFSVTFDKSDGSFTFDNADEADSIEWRKSTDYYWHTFDIDEASATYDSFLDLVKKLRTSGASIILRIPQVKGTGANDVGMWPSVERTVSIPVRTSAPTIRVNSSKLTLNTTTAMEYYDSYSDSWIECTDNMSLDEIAPKALYANGAKDVTVLIRKEETDTDSYSKTAHVKIPAQDAAPVIGDSSDAVTYYYMNSKLILQFNKASSSNVYEYTIVKSGSDFDMTTASWRSVKSANIMTLTQIMAPDGCTVYVRKKGTDANTATDTSLVLSSAIRSFKVNY